MKRILYLSVVVAAIAVLHSCYYDNPPDLVPFDCEEVSYVTHIQPIWDARCATSGCHDGNREPNLTAEVGYTELTAGGYVNTAVPEESSLWKTVNFERNPMPPGGPQLSDRDLAIILCWLEVGAPNN